MLKKEPDKELEIHQPTITEIEHTTIHPDISEKERKETADSR
ncbi:hypothetical protein SAMN05421736_104280 [Evansella caseinilytica]|uniref:Uncharacterized protein n=1 Tax=Evansella caseinilytica TaxID=1503961 RepID=A0A1H3P149_9BACI|nr:hypothetical protein [Evansella caseinilytica]SDY94515.1 hypothetical protein SAMN05421736_104280 [Evansella caseinilytica]